MTSRQVGSIVISAFLMFQQTLIAGNLKVDTNAPKKNQANLIKAPNGVPIANIANPNSKGLSHNKFTDFSVAKKGLILNNSKTVVETQLGGFISYNPNIKNNEANLILNEVTGTNKTLLRGYTEVAGRAADVIVANPNGISVNGGGFINTPNATLTTGTPMVNKDLLRGFDINGGNIIIEGDGFNVNNIAKVNLYAKALELNAKLYADELNVVMGENIIGLDGGVNSKKQSGSGVSLDSTLLGGIYANTITLRSTDKGIGVNLPPEVLAQNSLELTADGDIVASKIAAETKVTLNSQSANIDLKNDVFANDIVISANKDVLITEDKLIEASNDMDIFAKNIENNGELNALIGEGKSNIIATNNINNEGLMGGCDVNIRADNIDNMGAFYSKNDLKISAKTLDNDGLIRSNKDIDLLIENALINQEKGIIYSDETLNISANNDKDKTNTVDNYGVIQSNKNINIAAQVLNNSAVAPSVSNNKTSQTKTISKGGSNNYDIVTKTIKTQTVEMPADPALILATGDINLDLGTLNNFYSLIASDGNIALNANLANNVGKIIVTTTTTITRQYRDERYCSFSGPSGACFRHKHRAAYRGTFTKSETSKEPIVNYGIQAKKSILGNVITLNSINDQLGILGDQQISNKLITIDNIENSVVGLQKLTRSLKSTNEEITGILSGYSDIDALVEQVATDDDLIVFKNDLSILETTIQKTINSDSATLSSLESVAASLGSVESYRQDITHLESMITLLKNNIDKSEQKIVDFRMIKDQLIVASDLAIKKEDLIDINTDINNILTQNRTALSSLDVDSLTKEFESVASTLRTEVNTALDLKNDIEYKIISSDEGLYQINSHNSLSSVAPVNHTLNSSTIIDNINMAHF